MPVEQGGSNPLVSSYTANPSQLLFHPATPFFNCVPSLLPQVALLLLPFTLVAALCHALVAVLLLVIRLAILVAAAGKLNASGGHTTSPARCILAMRLQLAALSPQACAPAHTACPGCSAACWVPVVRLWRNLHCRDGRLLIGSEFARWQQFPGLHCRPAANGHPPFIN